MDRRPLGQTGLHVSPLGLGLVKIGRNAGLKYPAAFDLPDDDAVDALLRAASTSGVNLFDTAPAYGASEQRLGESMRRLGWPGGRDAWVVCTKVGESFDADSATSSFDFSAEATRASVERSLARIGVDHLDVVLIHSDGRDEAIIDDGACMGELLALKRDGLIRAVGMSGKSAAGAIAAMGAGADVVMVTLNPDHTDETPAIERAREQGVGVLVKKALASGHAGDADAALAFAARQPGVSSVVVGTASAERLRANASVIERSDQG